jgi:hypothetical protein
VPTTVTTGAFEFFHFLTLPFLFELARQVHTAGSFLKICSAWAWGVRSADAGHGIWHCVSDLLHHSGKFLQWYGLFSSNRSYSERFFGQIAEKQKTPRLGSFFVGYGLPRRAYALLAMTWG